MLQSYLDIPGLSGRASQLLHSTVFPRFLWRNQWRWIWRWENLNFGFFHFQLLSWNILSVEGELVRWYCWRNLQRKMWTANTDVLKSLFHCGKCLICKLFHKCLTKTGDKHIQPVNIQVEIIQNKTIWPGTTSTSCQTTSGQAINQCNLYDLHIWMTFCRWGLWMTNKLWWC